MSDFSVGSGLSGTSQNTRFSPQETVRLQKSAAEFEALFIKQMLTSMRKTIPKTPESEGALIRESEGEKIFRDLLDGEYAKVMSQRGRGFGLKEAIMQQALSQASFSAIPGSPKRDPQVDIERLHTQADALNALNQTPIKTAIGEN